MTDETKGYYRRCFSSPDGRKVLAHLLADMGMFDKDGDDVMRNYAAKIMNTCGFTDTMLRIEQLIDKCFEIEQTERKQDV